jgi:hypothetical protein
VVSIAPQAFALLATKEQQQGKRDNQGIVSEDNLQDLEVLGPHEDSAASDAHGVENPQDEVKDGANEEDADGGQEETRGLEGDRTC